MRKARAAALEESTEHLIRTIGLGEILRIVTNKDELISKGEEMFDDFLRTIVGSIRYTAHCQYRKHHRFRD